MIRERNKTHCFSAKTMNWQASIIFWNSLQREKLKIRRIGLPEKKVILPVYDDIITEEELNSKKQLPPKTNLIMSRINSDMIKLRAVEDRSGFTGKNTAILIYQKIQLLQADKVGKMIDVTV